MSQFRLKRNSEETRLQVTEWKRQYDQAVEMIQKRLGVVDVFFEELSYNRT